MIELMELKHTLTQGGIQDGDIICFQIETSAREVRGLESRGLYSNPKQFYDFLQHLVTNPDEGGDPPVSLRNPQNTGCSKYIRGFFRR